MSASAHGYPSLTCTADVVVGGTCARTEASGDAPEMYSEKEVTTESLAASSTAAGVTKSRSRRDRVRKNRTNLVTVGTQTDLATLSIAESVKVDAGVQGEPDHELLTVEVTMERLRRERDAAVEEARCLRAQFRGFCDLDQSFKQYITSAGGLDDGENCAASKASSSQAAGFTDSDNDDDAKLDAKPVEELKGTGYKLVIRNVPGEWSGERLEQYIFDLDKDIQVNHVGIIRHRAAVFVNRAEDVRKTRELLHHRLVSGCLLRVLLLGDADLSDDLGESGEDGLIDEHCLFEASEEEDSPLVSAADSDEVPLGFGDAVQLQGLVKNTSLNGEVGIISGMDAESGRYRVRLDDRVVGVNVEILERYRSVASGSKGL